MKTLKKILVILTAALLVLSLASCDKSGSIKKAFEKEDYTVTVVDANNGTVKNLLDLALSDDQMEKIAEYEIILVSNGLLNTAAIIKFPSAGDLKDFLTVEKDGKKDTEAYDTAKENGKINGNCLLIGGSDEVEEIFN